MQVLIFSYCNQHKTQGLIVTTDTISFDDTIFADEQECVDAMKLLGRVLQGETARETFESSMFKSLFQLQKMKLVGIDKDNVFITQRGNEFITEFVNKAKEAGVV